MPALYPNPVIFLPGIMGSVLRDQYPVSPETVWSPFKLFIKAYERITPHPSDTRYELQEPARVVPDQPYGEVWGRPAPDLETGTAWSPPIPGLPRR